MEGMEGILGVQGGGANGEEKAKKANNICKFQHNSIATRSHYYNSLLLQYHDQQHETYYSLSLDMMHDTKNTNKNTKNSTCLQCSSVLFHMRVVRQRMQQTACSYSTFSWRM